MAADHTGKELAGPVTPALVGEIDDRGHRHVREFRKGCYYERPHDCCWLCFCRLLLR
jgi:hypothetical protein